MGKVTEFGYLGIGVKDADAWREFATQVVGMELLDEGDGDRFYLRMDGQHHRIVVHTHGADDMEYIGWRVAGPEEFDEMKRSLDAAGVEYRHCDGEERKERMVLDLLKFTDPGGNPTEVYHGPRVETFMPFHPGRRMYGRFVTGAGGIGHCDLRQDDLEAAYRFYTQIFGMRGSVEYRLRVPDTDFVVAPLFLHCNERDHSLALIGVPSPKRIGHLMIEVDNYGDVGFTHDLVRKRKLPVAIQLGKHSNDQMLSFYMANPSGWMWEYGAGARKATHQSEYYVADMWGHAFEAPGFGPDIAMEPG
jgi:2,3-dihydroxybiphenyl 1,2-dioxygenase